MIIISQFLVQELRGELLDQINSKKEGTEYEEELGCGNDGFGISCSWVCVWC
jgi:hypothetical protein